MAVNKVVRSDGTTLMDITPTTATSADVASGKVFFAANGVQTTGTASGSGNNPTLETEWKDVYSDWVAGYYYDPDNDYSYTQISSTETTWSSRQTAIITSCTPYANMIPVSEGEEWRFNAKPIHFDSKNKEVPSIIIFDSSKAEIEAYTRTYEDEWTEFTIPADGAWMAVLFANNYETYSLQKHTDRYYDEKEILTSVMADYRSYSLVTPPTKKTLTKGLICIGTDDINPSETRNLYNMFTTNNIPFYMSAIPARVKMCITDEIYKTNLDYMRLCVQNGGEIISHSALPITEQNKNDFDTMFQYFCKNKRELEAYGFTVRGIFKAGGTGAIYNAADPIIDAWATHFYEFGDYFTAAFPYKNQRMMLDDGAYDTDFIAEINNICTNHTYGIFGFHAYDSATQTTFNAMLSALANYTRGVDYDFVTPSQLYEALMPTTPSSGGATYSLSMASNVITLTGSDGSTSSVTLPVYTGGVT